MGKAIEIIFNANIEIFYILILVILTLGSVFLALIVVFLFNKYRLKKHSETRTIMSFYINIEEYLVIFITSLWIFNIFSLSTALIIWFFVFILLNNYSLKNALISNEYICTIKLQPKYFRGISIAKYFKLKTETVKKSIINNKTYKSNFFIKWTKNTPRFLCRYLFGLTNAVVGIILGNQEKTNNNAFLQNIVILTAILYYVYIVLYYSFVENEVSTWYGEKKFFILHYLFYSLIAYIIVIFISLYK